MCFDHCPLRIDHYDLFRTISDKGILVGAGLGAPPEFARVTMGAPEEMAYFYEVIRNNTW